MKTTNATKIEVMAALKQVFMKYGDAACFEMLVEAVECVASAAPDVKAETRVFNAAKAIANAARDLEAIGESCTSFPTVGEAFEVAQEIIAEMDNDA